MILFCCLRKGVSTESFLAMWFGLVLAIPAITLFVIAAVEWMKSRKGRT